MGLLKPVAAIAALSLVFLYFVGVATSGDESDASDMPRPDIEFTVTKDDSDQYRRNVEVLLAERVSEEQLESLASHLYEDRPGNTFIGYYIEGEGDYAYWATTHYNPDLNVLILGSNNEQERLLGDTANNTEGDVIGRWRVSRGYNSVITIIENNGEKRLIQRFQDGSEMDNPIQEQNVDSQTRLTDGIGESNGEYYIIGEDGRLQFWSNNGNYYTAPIDR